LINGKLQQWQSRGELLDAVDAGMAELTDRVARQFTQVVTDRPDQQYQLQIVDVNNYSDYAKVMDYLKNLQYVSDVQLQQMQDNTLSVSIVLKGDQNVFKQMLAIERVLLAKAGNDDSLDVFHYRLAP
jgi:hypothetical protein